MNTLPDNLIQFRGELVEALERQTAARRTRRRRRVVVRLAVGGAVAASALGVFSAVSDRASTVATPTAAASVIDRATTALAVAPGSILHVDMVGTQRNGDGSTVTWRDESWQQNGPPYDRRQIETTAAGTVETAIADGVEEVYDAARNTIYVSTPPPAPTYDITPGRKAGTYVLRVTPPVPANQPPVAPTTLTISAAQVKALRKGTHVVGWGFITKKKNGVVIASSPRIVPAPSTSGGDGSQAPGPDSGGFRDQILALLRSGKARAVGHATIEGTDTIQIESADGVTTYYVHPRTYVPVRLDTRGTDGGTSLRFRVYQTLPAGSGDALLSLARRHPGAKVDRNRAHYAAATARLFPNG